MKTKLTLILFMLSGILSAQDTLTFYFDNNWKETDRKNAVYYRKQFAGPDSLWTVLDYYMNGQMQMSGKYHDKELTREEGSFVYYHSNGKIKTESFYIDDKHEGRYLSYHENGRKETDCQYHNDELTGIYRTYYDNGNPDTEATIADGKQNGKSTYYHSNGKLSSEGLFVNGYKDGEWRYYDEAGLYIASEYHTLSFKTPCGFVINFENDRWVNINHDDYNKKLGNLTLNVFLRKDAVNKKQEDVLYKLDVACFDDVTNNDLTSESVAQTVLKEKKVKGKAVTMYKDTAINLNGGVLYTYEEKANGIKQVGYLYVLRRNDIVTELFFSYDKSIDPVYIDEVFGIISRLK